jgi:hypothetical protein
MLSRSLLACSVFLLLATAGCGARSDLGVGPGGSASSDRCTRARRGGSRGVDDPWSERCLGNDINSIVVSPAGDITLDLVDLTGDFAAEVLVSLDPTGRLRWTHPLPVTDQVVPLGVDAAGNVFVGGSVSFLGGGLSAADLGCGPIEGSVTSTTASNAPYVLKMAPTGECLWGKTFGQGEMSAFTVDAAGAITVAGSVSDSVDFGTGVIHGRSGGFLARLDPEGKGIWSKEVAGNAYISCLATAGTGDILVGGYGKGEIDLGGRVLASSTSQALLAARIGADGTPVYAKLFGPVLPDPGYLVPGVVCKGDAAGHLVLAVTVEHGSEVDFGGGALVATSELPLVVELDGAGGFVWQKSFPAPMGNSPVSVNGLAMDAQGSVVWSGSFRGTVDFGTGPISSSPGPMGGDWLTVRYEPSGAVRWARHFGSSWSNAVAIDPYGSPVVGGGALGAVDLGEGALPPLGPHDVVVAKLPP